MKLPSRFVNVINPRDPLTRIPSDEFLEDEKQNLEDEKPKIVRPKGLVKNLSSKRSFSLDNRTESDAAITRDAEPRVKNLVPNTYSK
jgi:hypothetical protein